MEYTKNILKLFIVYLKFNLTVYTIFYLLYVAILCLEVLLKQIPASTLRVSHSVDLGGPQEFAFLINFLGDLGLAGSRNTLWELLP